MRSRVCCDVELQLQASHAQWKQKQRNGSHCHRSIVNGTIVHAQPVSQLANWSWYEDAHASRAFRGLFETREEMIMRFVIK